jgi:hypothetical protein
MELLTVLNPANSLQGALKAILVNAYRRRPILGVREE